MRLVNGNTYTRLYITLQSCKLTDGVVVENTTRGSARQDELHALRMRGWVEIRNSGPHGGKRYHITEKGKMALHCANLAIAAEQHISNRR